MDRLTGKKDGRHLVVGAGAIGSGVARLLAEQGQSVLVVTRSGSSLAGGVETVAADAGDAEVMGRLAEGAAAIYNCANPPYHRWPTDWPPIAASLLGAAERSGAVLVTVSNLYGYGQSKDSLGVEAYDESHPMTESTPLAATGKKGRVRARMWLDALEAHRAGRLRAVEVRASDYVGPGAASVVGERLVSRVLHGKSVGVLGRKNRLHTWSFTEDVARMVVGGSDPRAWGHAWHAPSNGPRTQHEVADDFARAAGMGLSHMRALPSHLLYGLGLVSPLMRELRETEYQFRDDFVMDSSAAERTFGLDPTPWEAIVEATLQFYGSTKMRGRKSNASGSTLLLAADRR